MDTHGPLAPFKPPSNEPPRAGPHGPPRLEDIRRCRSGRSLAAWVQLLEKDGHDAAGFPAQVGAHLHKDNYTIIHSEIYIIIVRMYIHKIIALCLLIYMYIYMYIYKYIYI